MWPAPHLFIPPPLAGFARGVVAYIKLLAKTVLYRHCEERFLRRGNPGKDPTHLVMAKKLFGFSSGLPRRKKRSSQ
jgi:hypothetical protein